jgi:hypothetical protein
MKRDGNTEQEAKNRVEEIQNLMGQCMYDPDESERIFMEMLGLEPDYIIELLL